jgi:pyruvate/2-oxoglutarate dehydrogenase complex dihydrolipoamide dehydrogenase (E3) component
MGDEYDLIVVGAGSGGLSAAPFAVKLGARVALIEKYKPGGDCLFTGCVPSKALIKVARVAWEMRRAADYGLEPHRPAVDLGKVMAHVQDVIQRVYQFESPDVLAREGVELVTGAASFLDPHTIEAGGRTLRGKRFLICTGSRAAVPPVPGLDRVGFLTYDDLFHLTVLPTHLLVIGAGPIGMEMGQAFRRLGSEVTMFQRSKRLLTMADPECSEALAEALASEGVRFHLGAELERVEKADDAIVISTGGERIAGDALLVAAGRTPNVEGLGLEKAGVAYGPRGIPVDPHLRTNQPHIYACGDVLGEQQFTHYAGKQGYVAVRNALLPGKGTGVVEHVPWTIFTDPEVARAGLTEPEARRRHGHEVRVARWPLERVDRAQAEEDRRGFIKVIHKPNGEILGGHIVAGRAGEMIQELVLAMEHGLKLGDLSGTIHVYPTYSVGVQQAAVAWRVENLLESTPGRLLAAAARWTR